MHPATTNHHPNTIPTNREMPSNRFPRTTRDPPESGCSDGRCLNCQKQIKELRLRCSKIEEIEKYVNVLVGQDEQLKRTNQQLQKDKEALQKDILQLQKHMQTITQKQSSQQNLAKQQQNNAYQLQKEWQTQMTSLQLQLQSTRQENSKLQSLRQQLLQEGEELKEAVLQLEEVKQSQMRHIEQISSQLELAISRQEMREKEAGQSEDKLKILLGALERDNLQVREESKLLNQHNLTQQQQIHDLIKITTSLEQTIAQQERSLDQLRGDNVQLRTAMEELENKLKLQTLQLEELGLANAQKQKYAQETEHNYIDVKTKLVEMELTNQQHNQELQAMEKELQEWKERTRVLGEEREALTAKWKEREELLVHSQEVISECEQVYASEKQRHGESKQKIVQLGLIIDSLNEQLMVQQTTTQREHLDLQDEMTKSQEALQKDLRQKYESLLEEKSEHFKTKIRYLQSEISVLAKQQQLNNFE